jgi:formamidopyrimidine-DNA glycosylase
MAFEFPEAMNLAFQMDHQLKGMLVQRMLLSAACDSLIRQGFINLPRFDLSGRELLSVSSKGKWIFVRLSSDLYFLIALESGGQVRYYAPGTALPEKYHICLAFGDGSLLVVRILGWGFAKAVPESELEMERYPGKLGPSPLEHEFTYEQFSQILAQNASKNLKAILTNQYLLAGIGIGYFQEILYHAKIHPKWKAGELSEEERRALYKSVQLILEQAVQLGGSASEVDLFGQPGGYVKALDEHTYGKACPLCGTMIERVHLYGSRIYICPGCQKG